MLLTDDNGTELAIFKPSLITVIFNIDSLIDSTLFFISGGHLRYTFEETDEIKSVRFVKPRLPACYMHFLNKKKLAIGGEREESKKKCSFFKLEVTLRDDVDKILKADVKLFRKTAHVCGLKDVNHAKLVMELVKDAFVENQQFLNETFLDTEEKEDEAEEERRLYLLTNHECCTVPLEISEGNVVMTNLSGQFPKDVNIRSTFIRINNEYPGILADLTTMSKSNYLAITLFEQEHFVPIKKVEEMTPEIIEIVTAKKRAYLMAAKDKRSEFGKHTFFIYASGKFIQSSANHEKAVDFTRQCMQLLHSLC